jgi:hypothetical protein|tara:strand:+ start:23626 stop:23865 length:240 start_codon:yes stop_codon:yes gene_type:complete
MEVYLVYNYDTLVAICNTPKWAQDLAMDFEYSVGADDCEMYCVAYHFNEWIDEIKPHTAPETIIWGEIIWKSSNMETTE